MTDLAMSRRAVTRALAALSVTSIPTMAIANAAPILPREVCGDMAGDVRNWNAAMALYRRAKANCATYEHSHAEPKFEAERAKFGEDHPEQGEPRWLEYREWCAASGFDAVMEQCDILAAAEGDAQVALLRMPAPNLEALHRKLGQTFEADGEIALWSERIALTIRSDFMRLLPGEMAS